MKKAILSNWLRKLGLIYFADWLRFYLQRFENRKINHAFLHENAEVNLPPDYLIYESFQLNYRKYFDGGHDTAKWLKELFQKHVSLKEKSILDWGCGPGRIIRHLPEVIGNDCEFFGTDYNEKSIKWCSENLPEIKFNKNELEAHLPYNENYMDIVYGLSIFTHLSEEMHYKWFSELHRITKPGGILLLSTQGDNFKSKMAADELKQFENGQLVVRGNVKEGHRTYSAFHPKSFLLNLFKECDILEHIVIDISPDRSIPQDIWIVKKK